MTIMKTSKAITDMETYTNSDRSFEKSNTNALLRIIPEVDGIKLNLAMLILLIIFYGYK
ncbi:MAG: hypothetical protein ACLTGX_10620 [Clostridium sp.]